MTSSHMGTTTSNASSQHGSMQGTSVQTSAGVPTGPVGNLHDSMNMEGEFKPTSLSSVQSKSSADVIYVVLVDSNMDDTLQAATSATTQPATTSVSETVHARLAPSSEFCPGRFLRGAIADESS